jgi:hypothetical protein
MDLERLLQLIHQLNPPDRQVMLLYLEDLDAAMIGEIDESRLWASLGMCGCEVC